MSESVFIEYTDQVYQTVTSCRGCDGTGVRKYEKLTSYHNNEYEDCSEICKLCEGAGRYIIENESKAAKLIYNDKYTKESHKIIKITPEHDLLNLPSTYNRILKEFKNNEK